MAVLETIRFRLQEAVSIDEFVEANSRVENGYLTLQKGFNPGSRMSTLSDSGVWSIVMRWDSAADADASMASFMTAAATSDFLAMIDQESMIMDRAVQVPSPINPKVDHVHRLYLEGIRDGDARRAVEQYTGDRYTQHSTGVRDGVEGFVEFFEAFIERTPKRDISILRTIADGRYVFVHAAQNLNDGETRWVTTDLFHTDGNDRIIEHWDVISPLGGTNPSGRTQVDGVSEITDLDLTEVNKATVATFIDDVLVNGRIDQLASFISTESYIQHNTQVADGIQGLNSFVSALADEGKTMVYEDVFKIVGQGNFVVSYSLVDLAGTKMAVFDVFRLDAGRIVEHWDNFESIPEGPQPNSGKF